MPPQPALPAATVQGPLLLVYAAVSIVALVVLIARYKLNPFVTLVVVSLALGVAVGMPMSGIVKSFETGVGNTLGHIALVVALGTMLGKMMAESGGAERIAHTVIAAFGERRVHWAMAVIAFIVGIPVFFEVGFVLLVPIAFTVAKRTGTSMVFVGIPMVAGLSVVHGLVPPHPAALVAVTAYNADIGRTIAYALLVGIPTAALAGPVFGKLVSRYVVPAPNNPLMDEMAEQGKPRDLPGLRRHAVHHPASRRADAARELGRRVHAAEVDGERSAAARRQLGRRAADRAARQLLHARRSRAASTGSRSSSSPASASARSRS